MKLALVLLLSLSFINLNLSRALAQEPKTVTIRFYAPVNVVTVGKLLNEVDGKLRQGYKRIVLLISSPGGQVFSGFSLTMLGFTLT